MVAHRFIDTFPEFARELESLLLDSKEPDLAAQIPEMLVAKRCSCEDDFCATFYMQAERSTLSRREAHCVNLEPRSGEILVDVVSGRITGVEVLFRDDVRTRLRALFP